MKRLLQKVSLAIVVMAFICLGAVGQSYGIDYTITDLGTLGGESYAFGINDSGQAAGFSFITEGRDAEWHAFLYSEAELVSQGWPSCRRNDPW